MSSEDDFLQHLRATFRVEAQEHLQAITAGLLQLEHSGSPQLHKRVVEGIFRAAHSLKGAARAVEMRDIESVCDGLEDTFSAWKRQDGAPTREILDQLHARLTRVAAMLDTSSPAAAAAGSQATPAAAAPLPARPPQPPDAASLDPIPDARTASAAETVRVSLGVLDARLLEAEEMLAVKLCAGQRVEDLHDLLKRVEAWRSEAALPGGGGGAEQLKAAQRRVAVLASAAEQDRAAVARLVDDLLANSKSLLLLPFATIAAPLPRLVRDLCREQGKEAELKIEGDHIPLDKRILDVIKDPLIHLLRNGIDHGIEAPAERVRHGKPARAQITLSLQQLASSKVQITLADDGAGVDVGKVKAAAIRHGAIAPEAAAALTDAQAQALIFRSGVSTSPAVTALSGRGLGLAIVQEKATQLGGEVSVDSRPGAGTVFRIVLPALRATFRGILVEAGGRLLVFPTAEVECVTRARPDDVAVVEGRDTAVIRGRVLPLVRLAQALRIEDRAPARIPPGGLPVVTLGRGDRSVALAVDQVHDEQELLVKPLQRPLSRVRNIASASLLPTGRIALVLHVPDLLQSARRAHASRGRAAQAEAPEATAAVRSILVAEDSITSRMLIKGVLEAAGYRVTTAIDGMDALTRLRAADFDLVVSDIEMPRLNGFDLTARIRADRRLADLPVVLVTALETREDRERGLDVGANAYIVKSSFDQSTLVDTVRRML